MLGLLLAAAPARAQDDGGRSGIGVGVEAMTTGLQGATFVYDAGMFHVSALLGMDTMDDTFTEFGLAGRFYFVLHQSQAADFGIGGGLGIVYSEWEDPDPDEDDEVDIHFELGGQMRAFIVPNVAFSASLGFGIIKDGEEEVNNGWLGVDNDELLLNGHLVGALGLTYFFY